MGTKNNPGKFDCYAHAEPDEPMFVLLGRDPVASVVVTFWVYCRLALGNQDPEKIEEARACARAMETFALSRGKNRAVEQALLALEDLAQPLKSRLRRWAHSAFGEK